jgi:hypothetical protein
MSGAIPPLPQYAFMAWCSVKAQGLYLTLILQPYKEIGQLKYILSIETAFGLNLLPCPKI